MAEAALCLLLIRNRDRWLPVFVHHACAFVAFSSSSFLHLPPVGSNIGACKDSNILFNRGTYYTHKCASCFLAPSVPCGNTWHKKRTAHMIHTSHWLLHWLSSELHRHSDDKHNIFNQDNGDKKNPIRCISFHTSNNNNHCQKTLLSNSRRENVYHS